MGTEFVRRPVWPRELSWGNRQYDNTTSLELTMPDDEYLTDRWICPCRTGSKFTVKKEAVTGVVIMKTGHSQTLEEVLKKVVY